MVNGNRRERGGGQSHRRGPQARRPKEEILGRTMMECFPGIDSTSMFSVLRRCMAERKHVRLENEFSFPDGSKRWFELRFIPVPQGTCILSLDISEGKHVPGRKYLSRV